MPIEIEMKKMETLMNILMVNLYLERLLKMAQLLKHLMQIYTVSSEDGCYLVFEYKCISIY